MRHHAVPALAFTLLAACSGTPDSTGDDDGDDTPAIDAGDDEPTPDAAPASPDAVPSPDAPPGAVATVSGVITRSVAPEQDGVGNLYVAIFAEDPISNMMQAPVGQALIENANMAAADAEIAYSIADVPVRGAAYHVVAFLDDDGTANTMDPAEAGPDTGDLISLNGLATPTVTVSSPGEVELDIVLSLAFPF